MKTFKILGLSISFIIIGLGLAAFVGLDKVVLKKDIIGTSGDGFAVVELFTSEGCSSCPPADELLAKIQKEAAGKAIYLLAYHVDYWDRQGWKDTFSKAEYSERQLKYAAWLGTPQIYTPQVIINGTKQFVGSDEIAINNAIVGRISIEPVANLKLQLRPDKAKLKLLYQAKGAIKGSSLMIGIVQKDAHVNILRGENAGVELSHVQIVRALQNGILNPTGEGELVITIPKELNTRNTEVIAFLQKSNGEIIAANKADLNDLVK